MKKLRQEEAENMANFRSRVYTAIVLVCCVTLVYLLVRSRTFHSLFHRPPPPRLPPLILIWDRSSRILDYKPLKLRSDIPKSRLSCGCDITSDPGAWKLADSIMVNAFYLRRINDFTHFFPKRRPPNQIWTFYMLEPAQILTENRDKSFFHNLNGQFNITMTYRLDSDVPVGYGLIRPYYADDPETATPRAPQYPQDYLHHKTHLVAWFASNCQAKSGRLAFVQELQKHLPVDIYGDCGPLKCPNATVTDCNKMLNQHYKFYLSFESSVCKDYVTEKFFNPMQQLVVPVVLGGANYTALNTPPKSYIDARDFSTIKDLADYLLHLDRTPEEYKAYFEWKTHYKVQRSGIYSENLCHLCDKLNTIASSEEPFHQIYLDMMHWWHGKAECKRGVVQDGMWKTIT